MLVSEPGDGKVDCSRSRYSATVISNTTIDSAAFVRFEIPDVQRWSVGFVYHDIGDHSQAATFIWSEGTDELFARHWVRDNGQFIHEKLNLRIDAPPLRVGLNELSFRTSSLGSFLRLNDHTVIEVPAWQLVRRNGSSELCVGFHSEEDELYTIKYSDLRTRFVREGVSGSLVQRGSVEVGLECPTNALDLAHFADFAEDAWVVFDMIIPDVERWSLGFVYNDDTSRNSRTLISGSDWYIATHHNYDDGRWVDSVSSSVPEHLIKKGGGAGDRIRLEFETTSRGSSLFLNGENVLSVAGSQITRLPSSIKLCTHIYSHEPDGYTIPFFDLWAWTD